jgi:hypothetical protein
MTHVPGFCNRRVRSTSCPAAIAPTFVLQHRRDDRLAPVAGPDEPIQVDEVVAVVGVDSVA